MSGDHISRQSRPMAGALGARLRDMFDSVACDPLPEHLMSLVDQLERAYAARAGEEEPALEARPA